MTAIAPGRLDRPAQQERFAPSSAAPVELTLRERARQLLGALQAAREIDSAGSNEARGRLAVRFAQGGLAVR